MVVNVLNKIFGSRNSRLIKQMTRDVARINALEADLSKLTDAELSAKTIEFRQRLTKGEGLDTLLPEAFAVVREGSKRCMGMRHFDVQLIGGTHFFSIRNKSVKTLYAASCCGSRW